MKKLLFFLLVIIFPFITYAQQPKYSRAKIYLDTKEKTLKDLSKLGLAVDHGESKKNIYFISDFSEREINVAKENGYTVEIIIDDVAKFYVEQNKETSLKKKENADYVGDEKSLNRQNSDCNSSSGNNIVTPSNFQLGSMGGFFTYAEMLTQLNNMAALYPNLITVKDPISSFTSVEGRPIYWVKISDNPNVDETEPEVFYNSLHHAREAASLSQLIFYMWYLLENYSTSTEIQNLINNTEMYFVPCVNPDGYVYNQTTDPNGGGMWRKNRRNNNDGTYGIDLNRNYGFNWGYDDTGSSPSTNDDTYRGPSQFSEPETQALKYFCDNHQFKIALNYHTYGNLLIYPWGYELSIYTPDSATYVNYAQLLTTDNSYAFGTGDQTVGYVTNGDSDDWMYGEQTSKPKILSMTPEAGDASDGFWPAQSNIIPICKVNISQNLYMAHLAGKYAIAEDNSPSVINQQNGYFNFNIQRLGLDNPAVYTVSIIPLDSWITSVGSPKTFPTMSLLQISQDSISYTLNSSITSGQTFSYILRVNNGFYDNNDTITKIYGSSTVLFTNNGSSVSGFTSTGGNWGISNTEFVSPPSSITDSPTGNYNDNSNKKLTLNTNIDLTSALSASLNFWAKWEIEAGYDYVEVEASDDNGITWVPLCGKFTKPGNSSQDLGNPLYDGFQATWVWEEMSLNNYVGQVIKIRFKIVSDQGLTYDGFYFDDLSVNIISSTTQIEEVSSKEYLISQNIPNPANTITHVNIALNNKSNLMLNIYNAIGELVRQEKISDKQTSISIDVRSLSNGTYFYRVGNENFHSKMMKMVVLK